MKHIVMFEVDGDEETCQRASQSAAHLLSFMSQLHEEAKFTYLDSDSPVMTEEERGMLQHILDEVRRRYEKHHKSGMN